MRANGLYQDSDKAQAGRHDSESESYVEIRVTLEKKDFPCYNLENSIEILFGLIQVGDCQLKRACIRRHLKGNDNGGLKKSTKSTFFVDRKRILIPRDIVTYSFSFNSYISERLDSHCPEKLFSFPKIAKRVSWRVRTKFSRGRKNK